jgi:hypothetical protein
VQRKLQGTQGARSDRDIKDAQRQAAEIQQEQKAIANELQNMPGGSSERAAKTQQLGQRKETLEQKVAQLESQLDRSAGDIARESKDASRKLQEAAGQIRDDKIKEKLRYSRQVMGSDRQELQEFARTLEQQLEANIDGVKKKLDDAAATLGPNGRDKNADALERARELTRGVESLGRRMQEKADARAGQQGQQGQNGQRGQQGAESQNGQRGQQGQQGEGQQGQGQQGQQSAQGQRGQQGGQQNRQQRGGSYSQSGQTPSGGAPEDGSLSSGDARQLSRTFGLRRANAEALRRGLASEGIDVSQLDRAIAAMRQLERSGALDDPRAAERLETQVIDGLKDFEFALARKLGGGQRTGPALGTRSPLPEEYRAAVEEYYRSLAGGRRESGSR